MDKAVQQEERVSKAGKSETASIPIVRSLAGTPSYRTLTGAENLARPCRLKVLPCSSGLLVLFL